jgi:hypothetical protein
VSTFLLCHRHAAAECRFAFAAWRGFDSPLRHGHALSSCQEGGHALWWIVVADDDQSALALLPPFVRGRAQATAVSEVPIP